jgi:hypothetical protein
MHNELLALKWLYTHLYETQLIGNAFNLGDFVRADYGPPFCF